MTIISSLRSPIFMGMLNIRDKVFNFIKIMPLMRVCNQVSKDIYLVSPLDHGYWIGFPSTTYIGESYLNAFCRESFLKENLVG